MLKESGVIELTDRENAQDSKYAFLHNDDSDERLSRPFTYKNNLIEAIKDHPGSKGCVQIQNFSTVNSVTPNRFENFLNIAKNAGYTIYKVEKL